MPHPLSSAQQTLNQNPQGMQNSHLKGGGGQPHVQQQYSQHVPGSVVPTNPHPQQQMYPQYHTYGRIISRPPPYHMNMRMNANMNYQYPNSTPNPYYHYPTRGTFTAAPVNPVANTTPISAPTDATSVSISTRVTYNKVQLNQEPPNVSRSFSNSSKSTTVTVNTSSENSPSDGNHHEKSGEAGSANKEIDQISDEQAAATALLIAAGGPPREEFERRKLSAQQSQENSNGNEIGNNTPNRKIKMLIRAQTVDREKKISNVNYVSPSSTDGRMAIQDDRCRAVYRCKNGNTPDNNNDHDSIGGETRENEESVARVEDFPFRLHKVVSDKEFNSILHWMPSGKKWTIIDWNAFCTKVMPKHFPELCSEACNQEKEEVNCKGTNDNKEQQTAHDINMKRFQQELEGWEFQLKSENDGVHSYTHEFFIKIAPNLLKYMNPHRRHQSGPLSAPNDAIVSPPRIGRLSKRGDIFTGSKRKNLDDTNLQTSDSSHNKKHKESQKDEKVSTSLTTLLENNMQSPITPVFTLANQVSPPTSATAPKVIIADSSIATEKSTMHPRLRLQSNRGGSSKRSIIRSFDPLYNKNVVPNSSNDGPSPAFPIISKQGSFPVSKRGRRNVSSRGRSKNSHVIPKALNIPMKYDGISTSSVIQPLPPRPN